MPQVRAKDDLLPQGWIGQVQSVWIRWRFKGKEMTTIDNNKDKCVFETKRILVTPKLARETLDNSKSRNRRVNPIRVKYLASLMKSGMFMCTHQGIALDCDSNVIDGQHRLEAICLSGCSVYMMVSKGVPVSTMSVVDCNQPRNLLNRLHIIGRTDITPAHLAIARILEYGVVGASQAALGIEEAERILNKYSDAVDFAAELAKGNKAYKIPAPVAAVIARAYYTQDVTTIRRFVAVYKSEVPKNEKETAPLRLKRHVMSLGDLKKLGNTSNSTNFRETMYNLAESALWRFIKGEPVEILNPAKKELFEIPKK
jgi:hypothetical protein